MPKKLQAYLQLMRFHKPVGILLLLWPTLWALWIASKGRPSLFLVTVFTLGTVVMRAAGCVINDIADRKFDAYVTRTQYRPLTTGLLSVKEALIAFILLSALALGLVLLLNRLTIQLAFVGLLLAILYPFTKRWFPWPQFFLGAAFSWSVMMAFTAVLNKIPFIAWWVYAIALIWPLMYDTEYALVDREEDRAIGIHSTALQWGAHTQTVVVVLQIIVVALWAGLGIVLHFKALYFISVLLAAVSLAYQSYLLQVPEPTRCFKAFSNNQWVGLIIFLGIVFTYR
ncbi:MAG TPA: 4-hydroxybenzoate octaprenyltransferase [Coxiellaceae bacterium]|nr:4-hydroxybenzoate octaprenyltransferase [Coxiellaceae bacterium]